MHEPAQRKSEPATNAIEGVDRKRSHENRIGNASGMLFDLMMQNPVFCMRAGHTTVVLMGLALLMSACGLSEIRKQTVQADSGTATKISAARHSCLLFVWKARRKIRK